MTLLIWKFVHYAALSILFGGALFPFYGLALPAEDALKALRWLRAMLLGAAWLGVISGTALFASLGMPSDLVRGAWVMRLALAACSVMLLQPKGLTHWRLRALLLCSSVLLMSLALTGRAGNMRAASAPIHLFADVFHLAAAGIWIGALFVFAMLILQGSRLRDSELRELHDALARFSDIGSIVVTILIFTGILLIFLENVSSVFTMVYGRVLVAKLAMFAGMLVLAAANRFWLTPRLSARLDVSQDPAGALHALRISLLAETALAVAIMGAVAWLESYRLPERHRHAAVEGFENPAWFYYDFRCENWPRFRHRR